MPYYKEKLLEGKITLKCEKCGNEITRYISKKQICIICNKCGHIHDFSKTLEG